MTHATRRTTCRLCETGDLELVVSLTPTPAADKYVTQRQLDETQETFPLDVCRCRRCGHVQLVNVVDPKYLFAEDYLYETTTSLGLPEHFRQLAGEMIDRFKLAPGSLIVEMGSNVGVFLKAFQERGLRVLGVDPAQEAARKANAAGVETLATFFTSQTAREIKKKYGPAAIVAANNVFGHSDHLADMADGVRELLAPNGVFVSEVNYLVDLVDKILFDIIYHEHLCYHSVKPYQSFLKAHGLELFDVIRIATKAGSIRCFAQLQGGPQKIQPSVAALIRLEEEKGLYGPAAFKTFNERIETIKNQLNRMLTDLRNQGKSIAGYGASPGVTTLLYHFALAPYLQFIVDDNPLKQNRYSPGFHIPILPPKALTERKPDYVVILAWPYAEPIMKKNKPYLDQGGRFIAPMPEAKVLS